MIKSKGYAIEPEPEYSTDYGYNEGKHSLIIEGKETRKMFFDILYNGSKLRTMVAYERVSIPEFYYTTYEAEARINNGKGVLVWPHSIIEKVEYLHVIRSVW